MTRSDKINSKRTAKTRYVHLRSSLSDFVAADRVMTELKGSKAFKRFSAAIDEENRVVVDRLATSLNTTRPCILRVALRIMFAIYQDQIGEVK